MKIANADKLKQHFENVVDVKLFTPAQIITIIDTFSAEIKEGEVYSFQLSEDKNILIHNHTEELKLREILRKKAEWKEQSGVDGDVYYECSFCGEPWFLEAGTPPENNMNFCPKCGARMMFFEGDEKECSSNYTES